MLDTPYRFCTVSRSFMPRVLRLLSLLLVALWFSGTQHCELVGAGVLPTGEFEPATASCSAGGCEQLENVASRSSERAAKIAAPTLRAIDPLLLARLAQLASATETSPVRLESFARPLHWVAAWHFVRRMAPPSRAPDYVFA